VKHNISLSIQFVNGVTQELETDGKAILKRNVKSDFHKIADYKRFSLNKEQQKYEQIKHEVQAKIGRKDQIEHYFNAVDRQLQFVMKKKMFVQQNHYTKTNLSILFSNVPTKYFIVRSQEVFIPYNIPYNNMGL